MSTELLITNIGFTIAIIISLGVGLFVLLRDPKDEKNIAFFIVNVLVTIFEAAHVIGINIADPYISRAVFIGNAFAILIGTATIHLFFSVIGKTKERRIELIGLYTIGTGILLFFLVFPESFMLPSRPLFYFPSYYNPGPYYFIGDLYFYSTVIYLFYSIMRHYRKAEAPIRNRLKFFILGCIYGYIVGSIPMLPLYGFEVDPFFSAFFWGHAILFAYAVFKYDLVDLHIIAKKAFFYSLGIIGVGFFFIATNMIDDALSSYIPHFHNVILPLVSGIIIVIIVRLLWHKMSEADILKYEFITTATHKFRTPLTYINWSIDNLRNAKTEEEKEEAMQRIESASMHLGELTNILTETTDSGTRSTIESKDPVSVKDTIDNVLAMHRGQIRDKQITVDTLLDPETPKINGDAKRIRFVFQVIIENAILYTNQGGKIVITSTFTPEHVTVMVRDNGAGISKQDLPLIFDRFFRGKEARKIDTEGMGMGLHIAREIMLRHEGDIGAESDGPGKGSTFIITFKTK